MAYDQPIFWKGWINTYYNDLVCALVVGNMHLVTDLYDFTCPSSLRRHGPRLCMCVCVFFGDEAASHCVCVAAADAQTESFVIRTHSHTQTHTHTVSERPSRGHLSPIIADHSRWAEAHRSIGAHRGRFMLRKCAPSWAEKVCVHPPILRSCKRFWWPKHYGAAGRICGAHRRMRVAYVCMLGACDRFSQSCCGCARSRACLSIKLIRILFKLTHACTRAQSTAVARDERRANAIGVSKARERTRPRIN